jgi:hypothetical protein
MVAHVSNPEFVYVPVKVAVGIVVTVLPDIVLVVPVKLCGLPVNAVNVVALFVKSLAKL